MIRRQALEEGVRFLTFLDGLLKLEEISSSLSLPAPTAEIAGVIGEGSPVKSSAATRSSIPFENSSGSSNASLLGAGVKLELDPLTEAFGSIVVRGLWSGNVVSLVFDRAVPAVLGESAAFFWKKPKIDFWSLLDCEPDVDFLNMGGVAVGIALGALAGPDIVLDKEGFS